MTVRRDGDIIRLEGHCDVEDAEALVSLLQDAQLRTVDLGACRHLHTAVVQALLSHDAQVVAGDCDDPFIRDLLLPQLRISRRPSHAAPRRADEARYKSAHAQRRATRRWRVGDS